MQGVATKTNRLDNATLLARLHALVARDRTTTAKLLWHLAEVDRRGLYRDEGYSALFEYCIKALHMSEGQASLRIRAARLSRRFPVVLSKVQRGELHLSALRALAPVLTDNNHRALLQAATHKTRREVEQMLADRAPKPDVPNAVRRLPSARPAASRRQTTQACATATESLWSTASEVDRAASPTLSWPAPTDPCMPSPSEKPRAERGETTPLGAHRYRVQFTASQALHDQIRQAQDLLRHQVPDGDLATIVGKAMTLLVEQVKKRRFGHTQRPRGSKARTNTTPNKPTPKTQAQAKPAQASEQAPGRDTQASASKSSVPKPLAHEGPDPNNRNIPAEVRRKVVERDGARCTFVSDSGHRCEATGWLEFHHYDPFARGGLPTVENMAVTMQSGVDERSESKELHGYRPVDGSEGP